MSTIKNLLVYGSILISNLIAAQSTQTRKLSSFVHLRIGGSFDVIMDRGSEESAKIVAEGTSPDNIITDVKGNALELYLKEGNYRNVKIKVYLTYKNLEEIDKSGSGNLTCQSDLAASGFMLNASGSGNTTLEKKIEARQITIKKSGSGNLKFDALETEEAELTFSGSGNIEINGGHAKKQTVHLSGSGSISAFGLKSNDCAASISGSGNIEVSVTESLEGVIAGSGSIHYQGDAQVKNVGISGSGRIVKKT